MGIGNHETHHHHAHLSWLTLSIGLMYRKRQTNPREKEILKNAQPHDKRQ